MPKETTLRGQLILKEITLVTSNTDPILGINSDGEVTQRPSIDTSNFISTSLQQNRIIVGSGADVATQVNTATLGDILASTSGLEIKAGVIVNADINVAAAIAYSKLSLSNSIVNSDISNSAAIAYSKLNLANSIVNADISSSAAVTRTKLANGTAYRILANNASGQLSENAAITAQRAVVSDINGQLTQSTATATQIGYLSTLTSDVQSQINTKVAGKSASALAQTPTATEDGYAITWDDTNQAYTLTDPVTQGIPTGGSTGQFLGKNSGTNYDASWLTLVLSNISDVNATAADLNLLTGLQAAGLTTAELSYVNGVTSDIQTQITNRLVNSLAHNAIWVGNASGIPTQLPAGTEGYVLTVTGGSPVWAAPTGGGGGGSGHTIQNNGSNLPARTNLNFTGAIQALDDAGNNASVISLITNSITNSLFRQSAALSVVGNSTNASANVADISAGSDHQILRRSGTSVGFGSIDLSQTNAVGSSVLDITNGGTGGASASAARTSLGLVIGTDVQAYDAELTAIAGLVSAADRLPYFTGSGTAALATFTAGGRALVNSAGTADTFPYFSALNTVTLGSITAAGRALIDDANTAAQRTTLGLVIGTDVQANLGFTPENVANKENTTLDTSTTKYPTNRLAKEQIDLKLNITDDGKVLWSNNATTTVNITSSDLNKIISVTNAGSITVNIPTGLPNGFTCAVFLKSGAGTVTYSVAGTLETGSITSMSEIGSYAVISHEGSDLISIAGGDLIAIRNIENSGSGVTFKSILNFTKGIKAALNGTKINVSPNDLLTITTTPQDISVYDRYLADSASLITFNLPSVSSVGDIFAITGKGNGKWRVACGASQTIHQGASSSTTGLGGSATAPNRYDYTIFECIVANTDWVVKGSTLTLA